MKRVSETFRRHPVVVSVVLALLLHLALVILSMFIYLPGFTETVEEVRRRFRVHDVQTRPSPVQKTAGENLEGPAKPMSRVASEDAQAAKTVPDKPLAALIEERQVAEEERREELARRPSWEDLAVGREAEMESVLLETQERQLREQVRPKQISTANAPALPPTIKPAAQRKNEGLPILEALRKTLDRARLYSPENVAIDPEEGMPGFTPTSFTGKASSRFAGLGLEKGVGEAREDIVRYEAIDDFLDIAVYTYEDPRDQQKYFMIKIFTKQGTKAPLKVMPKEILFAVDSSLSISRDRLDEFKRGIRACLTDLNPGDVFNIVAFKDETFRFSPQSVPATEESIKAAERFVSSLTSNQQTDVYQAFKHIVSSKPARIPSNVILISDGRPTKGVVDSRQVIQSISQLNGRVRPIFAFSGGARVNRYLLDFVAYQNRGWSQFVRSTHEIDRALADFYAKIKDPIFIHLRYRLNGLDEAGVYPRHLPDFYKNAEFTLYGTYAGEDTFSMQLLGDIDGQTKELIFTRSLKESPPGTDAIMRGWAFNKIYHLISELTTRGPDPEIQGQIESLSRRYGIQTPYSPELADLD